ESALHAAGAQEGNEMTDITPAELESRRHTGLLARIATIQASHPKRTVFGGLLAFIVISFLAFGPLKGTLQNKFVIPGSDAQKATDLLKAKFGARNGAILQVVFDAKSGRLDTPQRRAAIAQALAKAGKAQYATNVSGPFADNNQRFSKTDPRIGYAEVQFSKDGFELSRSKIVKLEDSMTATLGKVGIGSEYTGDADQAPPQQGASELLGILVALLVLLIVFRTVVAAGVPIVFAGLSVGTAFGLLFLLANLTDFNTITPILVSMIGIGVGVDYTLFIVTRFRQALHDGMPPREAAAYASATAGRAVIFAGVTVAISITGLAVIGIPFITKLGMGGALGVLTAVLYATFLLPGLLALIGHRIDRLKVPFLRESDESEAARGGTLLGRWGQTTVSRSGVLLIAAIVILIALAAPVLGTRLGSADASTAPKNTTGRKAYDLLTKGFGSGFNGPVPIVVDQAADPGASQKIYAAAQKLPKSSAAFVQKPIYNKTKDVGLVVISPATKPQDKKTDDLIKTLRDHTVPDALRGSQAHAYVSGQNAAFIDISNRIYSRAPWFLLYIIGVTFLVLSMAFRSIVIALKAAITTLISATVGFGVLTFVFKMGHGLGLIGLDRTGPIESFVPPIAFAILFGLSMDYEVFLMSRIREEHIHGKQTRDAVRDGVGAIGRVVFAAAIIMSAVFIAFMLTPDRISKEFGLLLAVAILTDALIMRLTVVPALLTLLGEKSWYMPRWLDKFLPNVTIEPPIEQPAIVVPTARPVTEP
ncbi:MAG: putative drug exporter of the superfamily, partial [Gaiellales bacterium]|nr:putative drug exporter of the superfamily [Gaiellales bacterium]